MENYQDEIKPCLVILGSTYYRGEKSQNKDLLSMSIR